ncbi:uncharacterized protein LOC128126933 [Lactuca sativa]|uniref:uncharacterized protein LOC128126933 n=1 Tax=Lactuca sativa TaxID=4236 RepID=UPI0022AE6F48|nr:uncharacterized protein LOC128126933 [Lactuca sativa]
MVRTRTGFENGNQQPEPRVIERAPELEEGNYSRTVSQAEPQVVRRNNQDEGIERNRCKYKDFTNFKPSTFTGKEDPIEVMDWISEMELAFITCGCKEKLQTTYVVHQFMGGLFGNMYIDEYMNAFTDKMEFSLRIVPEELTKINKYTKGIPWEYTMPVRQALTLEAAIWDAKYVEEMIKVRTTNKVEVGEKRKFEGSSRSENKNRFMKSDLNNKRYRDGIEEKWCDKCRRKHIGKCYKEVTYFKCGKSGHYANKCTTKREFYFKCGEEGHFKQDCPERERATKPIAPPK